MSERKYNIFDLTKNEMNRESLNTDAIKEESVLDDATNIVYSLDGATNTEGSTNDTNTNEAVNIETFEEAANEEVNNEVNGHINNEVNGYINNEANGYINNEASNTGISEINELLSESFETEALYDEQVRLATEVTEDNNMTPDKEDDNNFIPYKADDSNMMQGKLYDNNMMPYMSVDNNMPTGKVDENNMIPNKPCDNNMMADRVDDNGLMVDRVDDNGLMADRVDDNGLMTDRVDDNGLMADRADDNSLMTDRVDDNGLMADRADDNDLMTDKVTNKSRVSLWKMLKPSPKSMKTVGKYSLLFLLIEALYVCTANFEIDMKSVQVIMVILNVMLLFAYSLKREAFNKVARDLNIDSFLLIVIIMGCIMRIGYCMYNNIYARAHDMWYVDDVDFGSKGSYLNYLIVQFKLPQTSGYQLYHPPFSYIASAISCFLAHPFLINGEDLFVYASAAKVSNCFASCVTLIMIPRMCEDFKLSDKVKRIAAMFVAFCPGMYIISGCLNEDSLCCLLILLEIWFTLRWSKRPSLKNTILLAVLYGLGLQTSMLCVLPAIYTTYVFVVHLFTKKAALSYILRYSIFVLISFPLGLWHYVRNYIKFNLPFNYIYEQTEGSNLWTGDESIIKRFFYLDIPFVKETPYWDIEKSYNLPINFIKTELFDEYNYGVNDVFPYILLWVDLLLTFFLFVFGIFYLNKLIKNRYNSILMINALIIGLFAAYSYLIQPFTCTLVARYYLALFVLKALCLGILVSGNYLGKVVSKKAYNITFAMLLLYSATSVSMFCLI